MDSTDRTAKQREVIRGFVPFVAGENVHVERAGGIAFMARKHLTVERGGGQWFVSAGNLDIRQGGGTALVARTARVDRGVIGALVAWNVHLAPGARVLLRVTPAVSVAAAVGFAAGWLLSGRRRSARNRQDG
jgi:hypothetical protein